MRVMAMTAMTMVREDPFLRPTMLAVVTALELAYRAGTGEEASSSSANNGGRNSV